MKVIGINGSPNPKGNTSQLFEMVFDGIKEENTEAEIELIQLSGKILSSSIKRILYTKKV